MQQCDESKEATLLDLVIALPVCLFSLSLVIALSLYLNRRRIVHHLHHKYTGLDRVIRPYQPDSKTHSWSDPTFSPEPNAVSNCILPDINTLPSPRSDRFRPASRQDSTRTRVTTHLPSRHQHLAGGKQPAEQLHSLDKFHSLSLNKPRGPNSEPPSLSRKEQLAHRSQLIQDTHIRLGSISPEPPPPLLVESPHSVADALRSLTCAREEEPTTTTTAVEQTKERPVSFSRPLTKATTSTCRPASPVYYTRPSSPTGSIRLVVGDDRFAEDVDSHHIRVMSEGIGSRLLEADVVVGDTSGTIA